MKRFIKTAATGRTLGFITSTIAVFGGAFLANAADLPIVIENYDPPTLATPGGWENGVVANLSRQYMSQGVGGSTALQVSATFPSADYAAVFSAMFQSGVVGGNDWATRNNTTLSFDIKIDSPGLVSIGVYLDAFTEYQWNYGDINNGHGTYSGASALIALGSYQPGVFQRIVLPLNDARWQPVYRWPDTSHFAPFFDPAARTYNNVTLFVDTSCLPVPGSFKVTVDNVQVTTKNAMVPFDGEGQFDFRPDGSVVLQGTAEHVGSFAQVAVFPPYFAPGTFEFTAANGDKLFGLIHAGGAEFGLQIQQGTGRFLGAAGSYRGVVTQDAISGAYLATFRGAISSVGSK